MGNRCILESKLVTETKDYSIDMSSLLSTGEAVSAATVTAAVLLGTDPDILDLIDGVATVSQNVVTQSITGGVAGVTYCLRVSATTNQSNLLITLCDLVVLDSDNYGS